jgi:hypothetical protein
MVYVPTGKVRENLRTARRVVASQRHARNHDQQVAATVAETMHAAGQPSGDAEYFQKLRVTCLRLAQAHAPNAAPHDVVREADQRFRSCVAFLSGR